MEEGDSYTQALEIAERLFKKAADEESRRLNRPLSEPELKRLRTSIVPPYDGSKFETKWYKLRRNAPSHTVVAHLQTDTYSHIHFDKEQARAISVREAARLQSFPDGFRFPGNMKESFAQIGNAVPPLLASALGRSILETVRGKDLGASHTAKSKGMDQPILEHRP
jgi:DNA (cytosine-5)-methyltransferase 1